MTHQVLGLWLSLLLTSVALCTAQSPLLCPTEQNTAINWGVVPSVPTPLVNLTITCTCDVTAFVCDLGCCCDAYCPEGILEQTITNGRCLPSGPPNQTLTYCVPSAYVAQVGTLPLPPLSSTTSFLVCLTIGRRTFTGQPASHQRLLRYHHPITQCEVL